MRSIGTRFAVMALCAALAACGGAGGKAKISPINGEDMTLGQASAPVQVIEYASAGCTHCAEVDETLFPEFKAKYIDTGQVHFAVRELITGPPAYAVAGFLLARCAGKDKYFTMLDAIYRAQDSWVQEARNAQKENREPRMDYRTPLLQVAQLAGMSEADFTKCVGDQKAIDALNKRVAKNQIDTKGQGTPIFYVNGKQSFPNGAPSMEMLDKAIADAKAGK